MAKLTHPADRKPKESRHKVRTLAAPEYNPEQELSERTLSAHDHYKRMAIEAKAFHRGAIRVSGRFAVVTAYKDGKMAEATPGKKGGWKLGFNGTKEAKRHTITDKGIRYIVETRRIFSNAQFEKMTETKEWATSKMIETSGVNSFDFGNDDITTGSIVGPPNDEYIPLLGGPFSKQLYLYDYLDMHAKSFWAKNHHPFAKAIVNTLRAYIIGKGTKVLFKDPTRQDRWDAFEKRANWADKLRTDTETLIWAGEIMTEKIKDADGLPSIAQIDPSTVWEIVTDPLTPEVALYFHQQYPTQWQLTYHASDKSTEYIINDIPGDDVIHVKINTAPGEKRGRSDLFAILSWLKRFRDYFNAKVIKAQMEESWALDISIDGSQADVDAVAGNNAVTRIPPAGSTRVHNKDVVYEYLQPTSSSNQGRDDVGEQLKNVIAVGGGIAPEWLGESAAGSTKETARTKEGPAARNIEDKQQVIERYICQVVEFVMETEIAAGNVKEDSDDAYEVIFPEGSTDDRTAKIDDIIKAETHRFISHERAATMVAKELSITSFDADEEKQEIQGEQDEGDGNPEWNGAVNNNGKPKPEEK